MRAVELAVNRKGTKHVIPIPSTEIGLLLVAVLVYGAYTGAITVDIDVAVEALSVALSGLSS